jgi:phage gpG-like protein
MAFNFQAKIQELQRTRQYLPILVGNQAKNHFLRGFRNGGFTDATLEPWAARKKADKNPKPRAILVKTGHLRGSIRVKVATFQKIEIGAYGIPYAVYHNQGVGKMPKRKFIGESKTLNRNIRALINREFIKILR